MITLPLILRCRLTRQRPTCALLLPTGNTRQWVAQATLWPVDQQTLRFFPVPTSPTNLHPGGVLVGTSQPQAFDAESLALHSRAVQYGNLAGRVYLPVEAEIEPAISERELLALLNEEYRYVWHPTVGLIAYEADEILTLGDLLEPPALESDDWSCAQPGTHFSSHIVSLQAAEQLSLDAMMQQGRDDIGSAGDSWDQLQQSPEEPKNDPLSIASRKGRSLMAGMGMNLGSMAGKLASYLPSSGAAGGSPWYERLQNWAQQQKQQLDSGLQAQRNKEVSRLLHLLESNPDEGLRYALPMGGSSPRGMAPPSNRLGERRVDFNLSGLGGGGAADYWQMDYQYQQRLVQQYHALANRELKLNRFRRAAYIYSHLLGDHNAAANALVSGGHYREAAVLYREKLGRPQEAAQCLAKGGLWTEAIELYEELQQYEEVGNLYRQLEQEEEAENAFKQAIAQLRSRDDYLAASRIYTEKLHDPLGAKQNLSDAWPHSRQAAQCVREIFNRNAQEADHASSHEWIKRLRDEETPTRMRSLKVELVAEVAANYPDASVTHSAADSTRVMIAELLPKVGDAELSGLMDSLCRTARHDRLLARDTQLYLRPPQPLRRPSPEPEAPTNNDKIQLVRVIHLSRADASISWLAAAWSDSTIYAIGAKPASSRMVFARGNWLGAVDIQTLDWTMRPGQIEAAEGRMLLATQPYHDHYVFVHDMNQPADTSWAQLDVRRTDIFPHILRIGGAGGVSGEIWGACRTSENRTWLIEAAEDSLRLVATNSEGRRLVTLTIDPAYLDASVLESRFTPLHANGNVVYVGLGHNLLTYNGEHLVSTLSFDQRITSIVGAAPNTLPRLAVGFKHGITAIWPSLAGDPADQQDWHSLGKDLTEAKIGINRGGYLIAADGAGKTCEVYLTHQRRLTHVGDLKALPACPLAILSAPQAKRFGIALANGTIHVYEVR